MKTIEEKAKAYDEAFERAKDVKNGPSPHDSSVATVEYIFPELRESEDERIRKRIVLCLDECVHSNVIRDYERDECLSYLEKQKGQKPTSFNEPYNPDEYEVVMEGNATSLKRKEQKPYCPSNDELEKAAKEFREKNVPPIEPISDELVEIIKGEFEGFRTLLKKKGIDYEPQRGYWEGFARLFDSSAREYVKEQKPTDYCSVRDEFDLDGNLKQKPADSMSKEECVKRFKALCNAYDIKLPNREYDIYGLCEDLHRLFGDADIQKPAEWSEEDEKAIERAIDCVRAWEVDYCDGDNTISERLKSLRPRSSWKPSRMQMSMLLAVINDPNNASSESCHLALAGLYEELKKL